MHPSPVPSMPAANLRMMHAVSSGLREDCSRRQPRPHSISGSEFCLDALKHEDHHPSSPLLRCAVSSTPAVQEEPAEVVFQPQGAWDFPLSRAEKVRRLLLLFESEADAHEIEATDLRKENENLKQQLASGSCLTQSLQAATSISAVTRNALTAASEEIHTQPRRRSCVIVAPEEDVRNEAQVRPLRRTAPEAPSSEGFYWNASRNSEATRSVSSPLRDFSPPRTKSPDPIGAWCPPQPAPRRRRRTTIFHLPPETTGDGDAEGSSSTVPMRAKRRTAPPTAAALAAAQAAAENAYDAVKANCRGDREEVVPFGSPPCSARESSCSDNELRNRSIPPQAIVHSAHAHASSIKAVRWQADEAVTWMCFVTHRADSSIEDHLDRSSFEQLELLPGETVQAMRGYAQVPSRGIADWIDLVTSTNRSVTLGSQKHCGQVEPTFTSVAETGQEICGFTLGSNGCVCDAQMCLLDGFQ